MLELPLFENKMPCDEAIHAKRAQFYYEVCAAQKPCEYRATEKCMGIDVCILRERFV